jgi:hypothetical protein
MRHHRWTLILVLLLASAATLSAEPLTGVAGLHARVLPFGLLPEATAAVFGPGENSKCMEGRLAFAAGKFVGVTGLAGEDVILNGQKVGISDLNLLTGEPDSSPIWDSHLTRVGDDLVHSVLGFTYTNLPCMTATSNCQAPCMAVDGNSKCRPEWWNDFTQYPHRNNHKPGARSAIWVFRSSDCGLTWSLAGKVDAATLGVKDPEGKSTKGFCGVPRRWEEVACKNHRKKDIKLCPNAADQAITRWSEVGGWDGHYLGADPETGRLVVSTLCAFGTGVSRRLASGVVDSTGSLKLENNDLRHHIFVVLDDDGKPKSQASLPQPDKQRPNRGIWRGAVMPLSEDRWAFAYGENGKVKLLIDDPLTGSFSKPVTVADFQGATTFTPPPWELNINHFAIGWDLALNRVPVGSTSVPGLPGAHQTLFRPLVQVASYTWKDGKVLRYQIHNVDPETNSSQAVGAAIRSDVEGGSVSEGAFIQGHRASLFYWLEERESNRFRVRYQVYSQGKPLLNKKLFGVFAERQQPGSIKSAKNGIVVEHEFVGLGTEDSVDFQGDYMKGAHYLSAKDVEHFFLVWNENGKVAFAEVRVSGLNDLPLK